ncbi:MAG: aminotransferase class V-fold PLP-dependent enzyme [Roseburia sp.]|nr:aminotransferase class V-fold PLP-dependent enzyme [Roseburia sp.]
MQYLDQKLCEYADTDMYPFHMPGHKRRELPFGNPYHIDITEIDGFDNLHHAEGILKDAEARAARLYGSDRCFYLVNGSTCGLLAAICAATAKKDKVLVARNSHKAVYHALYLNQLSAEYLYPVIMENDLQGHISPEQVKAALTKHPDIVAVIVTSPTYEGIVSDINGIAEAAHAHGVPLIVDSAHGAHLGFGHGFPESAVRLGADAVIMSLHKTLPSFTQTALLHLNGKRISEEKVKRYLGIFETSSPSYLLMAGMDACVRMLEEQRETLFSDYRHMLNEFYRKTADLRNLHVMRAEELKKEESYEWDDSKLVIFTDLSKQSVYSKQAVQSEQAVQPKLVNSSGPGVQSEQAVWSGLTGEQLHQILRRRYHLQMEMVSGRYVLGMTSIMDQKEGFDRLVRALYEIDENPQKVLDEIRNSQKSPGEADTSSSRLKDGERESDAWEESALAAEEKDFIRRMYAKNRREMEIYQAIDLPYREVPFEEAVGKMSADYIYLYPPGIPMIVPGEMITDKFIAKINECIHQNLQIEGSTNLSRRRINVVYF